MNYDVAIIGAGIAGCACARELSKYQLHTCIIEAGSDVANGATKANSGIIHAGYDPVPHTHKARLNVEGARLYKQLAKELHFSYQQNGSLVVAFSPDEVPALHALLARGHANGVENLRIASHDELLTLEPNLSTDAFAALVIPDGAIVNPYGACLAFAENAVENGVACLLNTRVTAISKTAQGFSLRIQDTSAANPASAQSTINARIIINAAGAHSGEMTAQVSTTARTITPRIGEYVLLDRSYGSHFTYTVFQVPTAAGKGVLVTPTTGGNLLVGPNAIAREDLDDTSTTADGLNGVVNAAKKTWPQFAWSGVITNFAGVRSSCLDASDFILGEPEDAPGFFQICGFDSPGLTSAPALAVEYAQEIAQRLHASENPRFNPYRNAAPSFRKASNEERANLIEENPQWGHMICRCEEVTEAEIVAAIHSPIPATTLDAIKWRTRAGMGRCQAGFCMPAVAKILARELGIEQTRICKNCPDSLVAFDHRGTLDSLPTVHSVKGGNHD